MPYQPETVLNPDGSPLEIDLELEIGTFPSRLLVSRYVAAPYDLAMVAEDPSGFEQNATVSVYLDGQPAADGCMWVKDYSENSGIWTSLLEHGIVQRTGRIASSGWVTVHEARLIGAAAEAAQRLELQVTR